MDKDLIKNLRQFRSFDNLLSCVHKKYIENINNINANSYKVPIIINILQNKEIVFSNESSNIEEGKDSCTVSNAYVACKMSLANFLNYPYEKYKTELELWFSKIIEKKIIFSKLKAFYFFYKILIISYVKCIRVFNIEGRHLWT